MTPYPITMLNKPSKRSVLSGYLANIRGVAIRNVMGTGNRKADKNTNRMNFFRFSFANSHFTSLSNSFTSRYSLEIIFQSFFTGMCL